MRIYTVAHVHVVWHGWQTPDGLAIVLPGHSARQWPAASRSGLDESGLHDVHTSDLASHVVPNLVLPARFNMDLK